MASGKKRIAAGVAEAEQATADMACTAVSKLPDLSLSLPRASDRSDRGDREYRNRESQLPAILRLPLVIILSFALSSLGEALLNHLTNGELGAFSRLPDTKREIAALTVWRL